MRASAWEDAIFGREQKPSFDRFLSQPSSGSTYSLLTALGIGEDYSAVYVTSLAGRALTQTHTEYALPLPVSRPVDRRLVRAALSNGMSTENVPLTSMDAAAELYEMRDEFTEIRKALAITDRHMDWLHARRHVDGMVARGAIRTVLALLDALVENLPATLLGAAVEEVPSVDGISVCGYLYFKKRTAVLYNEPIFAKESCRAQCTPALAVSLCTLRALPCYVHSALYDATKVFVGNLSDVLRAPHITPVQESSLECLSDAINGYDVFYKSRNDLGEECFPNPETVKAPEVVNLTNDQLRGSLRAAGVPVTSTEERRSLLRKFCSLMDETERRELAISIAANSEMYGLAAQLQKGRSKRSLLIQQLREAERKEDWDEALALKLKIDLLKSQTADPTADPGSYDPYLDQDEWYKPCR